MINGPLTANSKIWSSNATVAANTLYYFSFWVYSYNGDQLPSFLLSINNTHLGPEVLTARAKWVQIGFYWFSGNATLADISFVNTNTSTLLGNDFGIDDISLNTFSIVKDSVTVDVVTNLGALKAVADSSICLGASLQLNVTGAALIKWSPSYGLSNPDIANPIASPLVSTTYVVRDMSSGSCVNNDTVVVTVKSLPVVTLSNDTTLCKGKPGSMGVALSVSGGVGYNWFPATGLSNPSAANPLANPSATTDYNVSVTGSNGCKDTAGVTITVAPYVPILASADAAICLGTGVTLEADGAADYFWAPGTGLSATNIADPIANPEQSITYIVSSPAAGFCSGKDTVVITVNPPPALSVSPADTTICNKNSIQLFASGGSQYSWSPQAGLSNTTIANPVATPDISTTYAVLVTDQNGCSDSGEINIVVSNSVSVKASGDETVCAGTPVSLSASGAIDYKWFPSIGLSDSEVASPLANPAVTTTYIVSSPSAGVCSGSDTVTVTVNPLPEISITPAESFVCIGAGVQLNANGGADYNWFPATGLNNPFISSPVASPTISTTYTVQVKGANGCSDTAQAKIIVGPAGKIFVPNAFTPNGDGLNDCIGIKGAAGALTYEFAIYNRWGERVFHAKDPTHCWNGLYKGMLQPNGNFAYYLKIISDCGTVNEKGLITLIR